ncbi:MAG: SDR family oxidoreductase [Clostridiales Family XIII bacterium]|jgi:NAD(P)-dependent dehydrogenase (short-subunit alcohol dehydrogenase family)|nr:SDR family oxidoreductase [Clostridiales Family XIII bacterium]
MTNFKDRTVLVTGASKGIGYVIAKSFAQRGAKVALNATNQERLREACESLRKETGGEIFAAPGAVQIAGDAKKIIEDTIAHFGQIDILVNNAGVYPTCEVRRITEEEWDRVMAINAKGSFLMCRDVVNHMIDKGIRGRIINISSGNYKSAMIGFAHYCASKAAVVMLTKTLALEVAHLGITVNSVSPGIVDVGASEEIMPQAYKDAFCKQVPNGRLGLPEDIAAATIFLASDAANYINGDVIHVDGALGAGRYTVKK